MVRKSLKPYMFADGTLIPEGTFLAVPCDAVHLDAQKYRNPDKFDEGRYIRRRQSSSSNIPRDQLVTATPDFLAWGYGRAVCPGRFFAAAVMKLIMAHIILNYDIRLAEDVDDGKFEPWRSLDRWFGGGPSLKLEMRKHR